MTGAEGAQALAGLIRLEREGRFDDVEAMLATFSGDEGPSVLRLAVTVLAEQVDDRAKLAGVTADVVIAEMLSQVGLA